MSARNTYFLIIPFKELKFSKEEFSFTSEMIEKNEYSKTFVYLLMEKFINKILGISIVSNLGSLKVKIECLEINKNYRKRGFGSILIKEIKNDSISVELNSLKEAEKFYIKNGFKKSSIESPAHFIWER